MTSQDRALAIADNVAYVDAAVDESVERATAEAPPLLVYAGFSQGVAMAFRAALQGRRQAAGIIAVGGDVPPEIRENPAVRFPRTLLARGTGDDWYTMAKLEADVAAIEPHGGHVQTLVFDGGHEWTMAVSTAAGRFLADLLAP